MAFARPKFVSGTLLTALGTAVLVGIAGCSSGGSTAAGSTTPAGGTSSGSGPQVEVNPAGDIPDNQAYVQVAGTGFTVTVPEGWARMTSGTVVSYVDKYNSVSFTTTPAAAAPTTASATATELPAIRSAAQQFVAGPISTVTRTAGSAVLIKYQALSPVNPVTNKAARLAVERYEFWRTGREVVLTLAAPTAADNVDPWKKITNSFRWTA